MTRRIAFSLKSQNQSWQATPAETCYSCSVRQRRERMAGEQLPRRDFLKTAGLGTAAALTGGVAAAPVASAATAAQSEPEIWLTLSPSEQAFVKAMVDTIIPADQLTPSGSDCGLATFIDRQLAGGFGNGARLYRQGPFLPGK